MWHSTDQTHQGGRLYATGSTAQHTARSHGAHSQEWHEPSHDPHTVGNGFGNEKTSDPAGMCFLGVVLQKW
jgi:hypothetical protein